MKRFFSFRPFTKIAYAVLFASLFLISCEKQNEAFNSKLKIGGKDGIDVTATATKTDSTATKTP